MGQACSFEERNVHRVDKEKVLVSRDTQEPQGRWVTVPPKTHDQGTALLPVSEHGARLPGIPARDNTPRKAIDRPLAVGPELKGRLKPNRPIDTLRVWRRLCTLHHRLRKKGTLVRAFPQGIEGKPEPEGSRGVWLQAVPHRQIEPAPFQPGGARHPCGGARP